MVSYGMDTRYRHQLVTLLWDQPWTYAAWWRIEKAVARAQLDLGLIPEQARPLVDHPNELEFDEDAVAEIADHEAVTHHDVAAFLAYMRDAWGDQDQSRWIHFGLTSSDVVDTAQALRFKMLRPVFRNYGTALQHALMIWLDSEQMVLGRTHGQPAEPMAMKVRAAHWMELVRPALHQFRIDASAMVVAKISGPVGTYAHIPPEVEVRVANELGLSPLGFGGSQIAPRGPLGRWANSAAELVQACAKVAMDIRLMATHNEAYPFQGLGQVGSSSMPHKNNPVRAEQVTGLARLAAGYASMLQPLDLWLERDISHSCVERVAVPDLWHVVIQALGQTTRLLQETVLNQIWIEKNLENNANEAYTRYMMLLGIKIGMPYDEAREFGRGVDVETYDLMGDVRDLMGDVRRDFMSDYPKVGTDARE